MTSSKSRPNSPYRFRNTSELPTFSPTPTIPGLRVGLSRTAAIELGLHGRATHDMLIPSIVATDIAHSAIRVRKEFRT